MENKEENFLAQHSRIYIYLLIYLLYFRYTNRIFKRNIVYDYCTEI